MTNPPYYADETVTLHHGDALDVLRALPDASVDAVVTDPPYGLEFMGKDWDAPWQKGSGVGGHSAGFAEKRYKDGSTALIPTFTGNTNPTCRNCGGLRNGREGKKGQQPCRCGDPKFDNTTLPRMVAFQHWCEAWAVECLRVLKPGGHLLAFGGTRTVHRLTCAVEDAGFEIRDGIDWLYGSGFPKSLNVGDGRGTALKPAREPIVMARKPLAGTVAANVLAYGTGALNIDVCRVGDEQRTNNAGGAGSLQRVSRVEQGYRSTVTASVGEASTVTGRWPSNVVLSHAPDCGEPCVPGCPVAELDRQSGVLTSGKAAAGGHARSQPPGEGIYGGGRGLWTEAGAAGQLYGDSGGASRFFPVFRYEAKAPTAERPRTADGTAHPTVKPLDLMRWLVRLVTPPGGVVLEPFAGSGTTAEACVLEGFRCIAIEREVAYLPLIVARLTKPLQPSLDLFGGAA